MAGGCFLIDRSLWGGDPLFDGSFRFNLEDHDLGVRASVLGHPIWVNPKAIVRHGSGTPGLSYREGECPSDLRLYCLIRNRWMILAKCFARKTLILLSPALLMYEVMQLTWLIAQGKTRVWSRAATSSYKSRQELRRARSVLQAKRRAQDSEILRDTALPLTAYVRGGVVRRSVIGIADGLLRSYWRIVRPWL
jgi:GT2 family glycosyltransferase